MTVHSVAQRRAAAQCRAEQSLTEFSVGPAPLAASYLHPASQPACRKNSPKHPSLFHHFLTLSRAELTPSPCLPLVSSSAQLHQAARLSIQSCAVLQRLSNHIAAAKDLDPCRSRNLANRTPRPPLLLAWQSTPHFGPRQLARSIDRIAAQLDKAQSTGLVSVGHLALLGAHSL
jgi:hypothetical protein